jgi:hypothetical protein
LYPYHPLFDLGGAALEIIGERSDMLVARLPDGSRRGIPSWMFDETVCASVREIDHPMVDAGSLLGLTDLLERNGVRIRSVRDEDTRRSKEKTGTNAAQPAITSVRNRRNRATNTGRQKGRVRRAAARTAGSSGRSKVSSRRSE